MLSLLFLIPIALLITALIVWLFIWAVRDGQYDDLERAGRELLYDQDMPHLSGQEHQKETQ